MKLDTALPSPDTHQLNTNIFDTIRENILFSEAEVEKITPGIVKAAAANMKPFKTDVSESYTSDVFLHGPDILVQIV